MARRRKAVTLADVAAAAGVSATTVSHALNGTRFVSPAVREEVTRAARRLGYAGRTTPGRRPPPGRTRTLGLALTAASNPYLAELILGVEAQCKRDGWSMLLVDTHDDPGEQHDAVLSLLEHRVDGVVLAPAAGWEEHTLPELRNRETPFALVDRSTSFACDQVTVENTTAAASLVSHLLDLGHTRVGLVSGLPGLSTTEERAHGYRLAMRRVPGSGEELEVCGQSTVDGGRRATLELVDRGATGVFVGNNAMTIGALLAAAERRVRIPDDLALVAFDDFEWSVAMAAPLTTAAQPFAAVGATAVRLLVRRIAEPGARPTEIRLPALMEHRQSCGCPPESPAAL